MKRIVRALLLFLLTAHFSFAQIYTGNLSLYHQGTVDDFPYTEVHGDLAITGSIIDNLEGLRNLERVTGRLVIDNVPNLVVADLPNLLEVGGEVDINANQNLVSLLLPSLVSTGLTSVEEFYILNNPELTEVNLNSLKFTADDNNAGGNGIVVDGNSKLLAFELPAMESGGSIILTSNASLETVSIAVSDIGLILVNNPSLINFCGISELVQYLESTGEPRFQIAGNGPNSSSVEDIVASCNNIIIRGTVFLGDGCSSDAQSVPVANCVISVVAVDGSVEYKVVTDNQGNYEVNVAEDGDYNISLMLNGNENWENNPTCSSSYSGFYTSGEYLNRDFSLVQKANAQECGIELSLVSRGVICPNSASAKCVTVFNNGTSVLLSGSPIELILPDGPSVFHHITRDLVPGESYEFCEEYTIPLTGVDEPYVTRAELTLFSPTQQNILDATYQNQDNSGNYVAIYGNPNFDQLSGGAYACPNFSAASTPVEMAYFKYGLNNTSFLKPADNLSACGALPDISGASNWNASYRIDDDVQGVVGDGAFLVVNSPYPNFASYFYDFSIPESEFNIGDCFELSYDVIRLDDGIEQWGGAVSENPGLEVYFLGAYQAVDFTPTVIGNTGSWQTVTETFTIANPGDLQIVFDVARWHSGAFGLDKLTLRKVNCCTRVHTAISEEDNCSYDPNDLLVTPRGCGESGNILNHDELSYRIRFENIGFGDADDVWVTSSIDENLDLTTLKLGNSSHPVTGFYVENGELRIDFEGINLRGIQYPEENKGFVFFTASLKPGLSDGTTIENQASIVFNDNDPIITNRVSNTVRDTLFARTSIDYSLNCNGLNLNPTYTEEGVSYSWFFSSGINPVIGSDVQIDIVSTDKELVTMVASKDGCLSIGTNEIDRSLISDCGNLDVTNLDVTVFNATCSGGDGSVVINQPSEVDYDSGIDVDALKVDAQVHNGGNNLNINNGEVVLLEQTINNLNVNLNNGTLIITADQSLSNINLGSNTTLIIESALTFGNTLNVNSGVTVLNRGDVTIHNSMNLNGLFINEGDLAVSNKVQVNSNGLLEQNGDLTTNKLHIDGVVNARASITVQDQLKLNSNGDLNLYNALVSANRVYNDGDVISHDCGFVNSSNISGNKTIDASLVCTQGCTCPSSNYTVTWEDGYIGATRDGLDSGTYNVTISDGIDFAIIEVEVATEDICLEPVVAVFPNPQQSGQLVTVSLDLAQDHQNVLLEIRDAQGQLLQQLFVGALTSGVHEFAWEIPQGTTSLTNYYFYYSTDFWSGTEVFVGQN